MPTLINLAAIALALLGLPVSASADSSISEANFKEIVGQFKAYAEPFLAKQGAELFFNPRWDLELRPLSEGGAGGASASGGKFSKRAGISIVGGLARHPAITVDALKFALCHELGHYVRGLGDEFGADDFAGRECLPALWGANPPELTISSEFSAVDTECEARGETRSVWCKAMVRVAWSVAHYSMFLWKQIKPEGSLTPVAFGNAPNASLGKYDGPQCRLVHLTAIALGKDVEKSCL